MALKVADLRITDSTLLDRIAEANPHFPPKPKPPRLTELFLRGPIPMRWLQVASTLGGSALWVGCILWHLAGFQGTNTFIVSTVYMRRWGVDRGIKSRALKALAAAGLIAIEARSRRNPVVTIILPSAG